MNARKRAFIMLLTLLLLSFFLSISLAIMVILKRQANSIIIKNDSARTISGTSVIEYIINKELQRAELLANKDFGLNFTSFFSEVEKSNEQPTTLKVWFDSNSNSFGGYKVHFIKVNNTRLKKSFTLSDIEDSLQPNMMNKVNYRLKKNFTFEDDILDPIEITFEGEIDFFYSGLEINKMILPIDKIISISGTYK